MMGIYGIRLLLGVFLGFSHADESFEARVARVYDGDSFAVELPGEERWLQIRLLGIDAPERSQPFARKSKEQLSERILDQVILIEPFKRDEHGRLLARAFIKGEDVSLTQLEKGLAWFNTPYMHEYPPTMSLRYQRAALRSQQNKIGLWSQSVPQSPWTFRREQRETTSASWRSADLCARIWSI